MPSARQDFSLDVVVSHRHKKSGIGTRHYSGLLEAWKWNIVTRKKRWEYINKVRQRSSISKKCTFGLVVEYVLAMQSQRARDPGSIPGRRKIILLFFLLLSSLIAHLAMNEAEEDRRQLE